LTEKKNKSSKLKFEVDYIETPFKTCGLSRGGLMVSALDSRAGGTGLTLAGDFVLCFWA